MSSNVPTDPIDFVSLHTFPRSPSDEDSDSIREYDDDCEHDSKVANYTMEPIDDECNQSQMTTNQQTPTESLEKHI